MALRWGGSVGLVVGLALPLGFLVACGDNGSRAQGADACNQPACGSSDAAVPPDGDIDRGQIVDAPAGDIADLRMDGQDGCVAVATCDDHNSCTRDQCVNGACTHSSELDGTLCDDGQLCTSADMCQAGICVGTPRATVASVVATAYAFGGAFVNATSDFSRSGLVSFASNDRLLFADRLDSDATVLTLVSVTAGVLHVLAQTVTDSGLETSPLNGRVWQSVPTSQLVILPNDRFALFSDRRIQVFQVTTDGHLVELWRAPRSAENTFDATWAGDSIWTCTAAVIVRYVVEADGSLVETPIPELAPAGGCVRMAIAPDGVTVYASNPGPSLPGIFRWSASGTAAISPEVVLPGVAAIDMAVDEGHLALQRMGEEADLGDTEVYRLTDFARVAVFSPTATNAPFALALSSGRLFLEWMRSDATSRRVTGAVYNLDAGAATPLAEWPIRTRSSSATDSWALNVEHLSAAAGRIVMGPWRHIAQIDPATGSATWITGPGHGEVVGVQAAGANAATTFSPYSIEQLDLTEGIRFSGGGMVLAPDVQRLQVVLPDDVAPPTSFQATPEPQEQRAETEPVTVMRSNPSSGLEVAGEIVLDGGPAKLVQRGRKLYQVAAVGTSDYRIRVFNLGQSVLAQPLVPDAAYTLTVSGGASGATRGTFYVPDVDPELEQIAVTEIWSNTAGAVSNWLVWASLREPSTTVVAARTPLDSGGTPIVRGGRLMVVGSRATVYAADGTGGVTEVARTSCDVGCYPPLGTDAPDRAYVTDQSSSSNGVDLLVISMVDGSVLSRAALGDGPRSAAVVGDRLLLGATHSISVLEPSCGAAVDAGTTDAGTATDGSSDAIETGDAASVCGEVANCSDGGLTRSSLVGDLNGDGCVDTADIGLVTACVGKPVQDACSMSYLADLDGNGSVDIRDYLKVVGNQGKGCDANP